MKKQRMRAPPGVVMACCLLSSTIAQAIELDTGDPDLSVRFDNTVKIGTIYRLRNADPGLADSFSGGAPTGLSFNAGDDNFRKKGFVSQRVDLLTELDAVYKRNFGVRVGLAAWYDHSVRGRSDATDPMNGQSPYNVFTDYTKRGAGRKAEVLDAFVFGGWDFGDGKRLTARLGQHSLQWGESLFFGDNAISRAQGPIDIYKLLASPNAQFKEIIRPVPQISAQLQLSSDVSVGAYYQFRWKEDRLPPAGSYFSSSNLVWGGSPYPQLLNLGPGGSYDLAAGADRKPKDSGQFGLQLKWRVNETDLGFYYAQYHDKGGQLYGQLNPLGAPNANGYLPGNWYYRFGEDVKVVGASVSRSFGDTNVSLEASVRDNMPLRGGQNLYGFFPGQEELRRPIGRTAHVNLSWLANFGPNFIANESGLIGEIAWNRVLSMKDPDHTIDSGRTRDAAAIQLVYTPTYRQVMPGLDISIPIGLRYILAGRSSVTSWDAKGTGSATIGIDAMYLNVWQVSLNYTHYIGKSVPYIDYSPAVGTNPNYGWGNSLADRKYVSLSVRRTF
ncbi:DUF1302 domain-containing protein [Variovorax paradoxus]|uniref:DUF1302 domain-containing protein n=1 Tax=Variovorax paradoxus TaxID=34073 RepID=UPI002786FAB0|nr:DUF1302 family protein [Variovorax paradoxus]MDP9932783.1 hypothetical protein [Variovorax paradoxus]